ncbi:nucleotidyl transferase AbiEii/AbiGii toxin family protein [Bradyrhizobium sp. USDA 4473]
MSSFFDNPASLQKAAALLGARRVDYVEIDVILTHLLQRMSEAGLMDHLVFKGGTMLRKMIFGQTGRLSTDLDFVVRSASRPTTWRSRSLPSSLTTIEE